MFKQAGLKNTSENEVKSSLKCGTVDVYWNMITEVSAPFVSALSKADDAMREKIRQEVYALINEKYPDGNVLIDSSALFIYGEK